MAPVGMNWARRTASGLREMASELDWSVSPSLSATVNQLRAVLGILQNQSLLEQKVREEWTRTDLDYDPGETIDEFEEAIEEIGAKVVDEGPDHLKMDVVRGKEDERRDRSEEMVRGRHGPELKEFAEAYGA